MSSFRLRHLPQLDGLRAVAVLLVLWVHFPFVQNSYISKTIWTVGQAARTGYIGVDLFFVLSGFLITRILLDERLATGRISLAVFYGKRALRIFPIYYLCVAVYALTFTGSPGSLASLLTYTFNFYHPFHPEPNALEHTWSLAVEEQFYLVWPLLIAWLPLAWGRRVTATVIPAISILVALVFAVTFSGSLAGALIYMSGPTRMMSLSLGASLAYRERAAEPMAERQSWFELGAGVAVLAADNVARALGVIPAGGFYWSIALVGYALVSLGSVSLLIFARDAVIVRVRALLSCAPLRAIGRMSYGIYLYHYLILFLIGIPPYLVFDSGATATLVSASLAATFLTAALSYRFIETPLLSLKSRLGRAAQSPDAGITSPRVG